MRCIKAVLYVQFCSTMSIILIYALGTCFLVSYVMYYVYVFLATCTIIF